MGRADEFYGKHDVDAVFHGNPTAPVPLERASRKKKIQDYDKSIIHGLLRTPPGDDVEVVDPRELHNLNQPMVTRAGVQHYMQNDDWKHGGQTYADQDSPGNRFPIVYDREDGQRLLLSGRHRATAALLKGEGLPVRRVSGPWGPPRGQ